MHLRFLKQSIYFSAGDDRHSLCIFLGKLDLEHSEFFHVFGLVVGTKGRISGNNDDTT
jgi:hypothetical protein